ncbi:MAG: glycosyltransferase family 4 protein [Betaproteobacteria bacterium]|nr:glycosyltransferase family 4 protein [Betaproteobacteria bacterium]
MDPQPAPEGVLAASGRAGGLHIVHTEASCGWGGQEMRILSESLGMMERGHRITLLCPPQARIFEAARARGIVVEALPIGRKNLKGLLALRRWLRDNPADVINTHSSTDTWLAALACATLRIPLPPGRPKAGPPPRGGSAAWGVTPPPIVRTRHISAALPPNATTRWLYNRATRHIVTTGETLRRQVMETLGCGPEHVTSIPTGIDTAVFAPGDRAEARRRLELPQEALLVGIVATLRSWKGHLYLLDAFAALGRDDARLVIVGDGPMRDVVRGRIAELGLDARVIQPGNREDVATWLQALDIFCLPSYANEGVPQALVQAMLSGLPCVTTGVGAIGEAAVDGRTALVVPPRDAGALADALRTLLCDPARRSALGTAAREHCAARFSRQVMLERMEAVFHRALGDARARNPVHAL